MKLSTLRKMAKKQKVEGYEEMEREELIKTLKVGKEELKEESDKEPKNEKEGTEDQSPPTTEEKLATPEEIKEKSEEPEPKESKIITGFNMANAPINSKAAQMKKKLDAQPKISILIPLEGEKFGTTFPVTLNGLRVNILKGIYVPVPKQIADIVADNQKQTLEALAGPMRKLAKDGLPMKFDGEMPQLTR